LAQSGWRDLIHGAVLENQEDWKLKLDGYRARWFARLI
jgi:hypothetical protein